MTEYSKKKSSLNLDHLFEAVLSLKTTEECYQFFKDLCTVQELKAISQRLEVAKRLYEDEVYAKIVDEVGASTATISRVNRSLIDGCGGYAVVFDRMAEQKK